MGRDGSLVVNEPRSERQALVLSGGGAYGAYEAGILKGLASRQCPHSASVPFDPDVYAGSSAGAVNAAVFAAHLDTGLVGASQFLEAFWINHIADGPGRCGNGVYRLRSTPFDLLDPDCIFANPFSTVSSLVGDSVFLLQESFKRGVQFASSTENLTRRMLRTIDIGAFIVTTRIQEGLAHAISLDGIRRSGKELRIISTNFDNGDLVVFDERDVVDRHGIDTVLASASVPGFFSPVIINGQRHVDGQTLLNAPLMREFADCDIIHLVYMDPDIAAIPPERLQSTIDVLDRIIVINNAYKINQDLETLLHINRSLELLESISGINEVIDERVESFLKAASRIAERLQSEKPRYRKLTVHRYHPREDLGGVLGFMNLGHQHILGLIARGYRDALEHDCIESGCIIPEKETTFQSTTRLEETAAW
jgi:predicted acylesterase/phospholipase RssA